MGCRARSRPTPLPPAHPRTYHASMRFKRMTWQRKVLLGLGAYAGYWAVFVWLCRHEDTRRA